MKMFETEGRCPLCINQRAFDFHRISLTCERKSYTFSFRIYYCHYHGYFVWRGKKGHQLVDFSKLQHQATKVEPFPSESPDTSTMADYLIVKMECPYCEHEWEQYDKTWTYDGNMICPKCGVKIPKEKALVKR